MSKYKRIVWVGSERHIVHGDTVAERDKMMLDLAETLGISRDGIKNFEDVEEDGSRCEN